MISSGVLSSGDYHEVFTSVFMRATTFQTTSSEDAILKNVGFYGFIKDKIMDGLLDQFDDANARVVLVIKYLQTIAIDKDVAKSGLRP